MKNDYDIDSEWVDDSEYIINDYESSRVLGKWLNNKIENHKLHTEYDGPSSIYDDLD